MLTSQSALSRAALPSPTDDDDLVNSSETRRTFGNVTEMTLWRWIRSEKVRFPKPIRIATRNYWRRGDLRRLKAELEAQTEAQNS